MPAPVYCPHCDAPISPVASFCDQCGHKLPATRNTIPLQARQKTRRLSSTQQLTLVNCICTIIIITLSAYQWLAASGPAPAPIAATSEPVSAPIAAAPAALSEPAPSPAPVMQPAGACDDIQMYPKYYRKYEADSNAELLELPHPKLTPDAIAHKEDALGKMLLELILAPCGVMDHMVFRGHMPYGLSVMVEKAAKQISFRPALVNGQPVPQQMAIEYIFYACDTAPICTDVREVVK